MRTGEEPPRPRIGIPYRTRNEERNGVRGKYDRYLRAVAEAGGSPVEISLALHPEELARLGAALDAVLLPGSPADVNPALFRSARHPKSSQPDGDRERTDGQLLEIAMGEGKPVLAVCYGVQILNVHLGGTLFQDLASELRTPIEHSWKGREQGQPEPHHAVEFRRDSRLGKLAGVGHAQVNSSHHQSVRDPGKGLEVTGRAMDGVIESVEWTGDSNWITGVQWHPERMSDPLARSLFKEFVLAASKAGCRA